MKLLKPWIWDWVNFALARAPLRLRSLMRVVPAIVPTDYPGVSIVVHSRSTITSDGSPPPKSVKPSNC